MEPLLDGARDLVVNIVAAAALSVIAATWAWNRRRRARRLWPLDVSNFAVILSTSAVTHTGLYNRPASGVGQIRALAIIAPTIARAWRWKADVSNVILSMDATQQVSKDVVLLGGPKNNEVTRQFLDSLKDREEGVPFSQKDSEITWGDQIFSAEVLEGANTGKGEPAIVSDYGLIVRCENPFDKRKTVILLSGASTYGTIAAALWYVGHNNDQERPPRSVVGGSYAALVKSEVNRGHVGRPTLVKATSL